MIFLALAADEMASVHELMIRPMAELFPSVTSGWLLWGVGPIEVSLQSAPQTRSAVLRLPGVAVRDSVGDRGIVRGIGGAAS